MIDTYTGKKAGLVTLLAESRTNLSPLMTGRKLDKSSLLVIFDKFDEIHSCGLSFHSAR